MPLPTFIQSHMQRTVLLCTCPAVDVAVVHGVCFLNYSLRPVRYRTSFYNWPQIICFSPHVGFGM